MRIRGGSSIFGSTAPAQPGDGAGPGAETATGPESAGAGPATEPAAAQAEQQGVTKEQAIECAKSVLMFLEKS